MLDRRRTAAVSPQHAHRHDVVVFFFVCSRRGNKFRTSAASSVVLFALPRSGAHAASGKASLGELDLNVSCLCSPPLGRSIALGALTLCSRLQANGRDRQLAKGDGCYDAGGRHDQLHAFRPVFGAAHAVDPQLVPRPRRVS